jgi:hypothetical protein
MKKIHPQKNNMKIRSLILAFIIISVNCKILSAQTSKGKFLIGELSYIELLGNGVLGSANLGYSTFQNKSDGDNDNDKDKMFSINIVPRAGYFVINNLAIGLDVLLATEKVTSGGDVDYTYNSTLFAVGPFVRYYVPTKKVLPFAEVNYSMGSRTYTSEFAGNEPNTDKYAIKLYGAGLGLAVPIGEKVSFDIVAGYHTYVNKDKEDNEDNERFVAGTIGLKFGFTVFLGPN